jgi:hypothetical protein
LEFPISPLTPRPPHDKIKAMGREIHVSLLNRKSSHDHIWPRDFFEKGRGSAVIRKSGIAILAVLLGWALLGCQSEERQKAQMESRTAEFVMSFLDLSGYDAWGGNLNEMTEAEVVALAEAHIGKISAFLSEDFLADYRETWGADGYVRLLVNQGMAGKELTVTEITVTAPETLQSDGNRVDFLVHFTLDGTDLVWNGWVDLNQEMEITDFFWAGSIGA